MKRTSALARLAVFAVFALGAACAQRAPTIQFFAAAPPEIAPGGTSMLVWEVSGATSLSLEPDIGPAIGEVTGPFVMVQPASTTTYTLTAAGDAGTAQASVTVSVTVSVTAGGAEESGQEGEPEDEPEDRACALEEAGAIEGALTLSYSGSAQGGGNEVGLERRADITLTFSPTPHGHWAATAMGGGALVGDTYRYWSLAERIEGEGAPNPETSTLRLDEDCTVSARVVVSVEAENSTVFGTATSTVGVVYLEGVAPSGEADLKAHTWHFGGASGVSLTQGQSYVEGFAQDLGMILGHDALGTARVSWSFAPAP